MALLPVAGHQLGRKRAQEDPPPSVERLTFWSPDGQSLAVVRYLPTAGGP